MAALYRAHGGIVYTLSQGFRGIPMPDGSIRPDPRGTRQTKGIADLEIFFPLLGRLAKHETKTPAGMALHRRMMAKGPSQVSKSALKDWRRAQAQDAYGVRCQECEIAYARGGVPEALALLVSLGMGK